MGRENGKIGKAGEEEAVGFLKRNGYKIIATNFRTPFGELDAIAKIDDFIVFIEVKTRATPSLGPPTLSVTGRKAIHIVKNALFYLKRYGLIESSWRIDVVSVNMDFTNNTTMIKLIENAVTTYGYDHRGGLI